VTDDGDRPDILPLLRRERWLEEVRSEPTVALPRLLEIAEEADDAERCRDVWAEIHRRRDDQVRAASPQAWRRVQTSIAPSEISDIARDIAETIALYPEVSTARAIERALIDDWAVRRQA
jgi:hypothetical protein